MSHLWYQSYMSRGPLYDSSCTKFWVEAEAQQYQLQVVVIFWITVLCNCPFPRFSLSKTTCDCRRNALAGTFAWKLRVNKEISHTGTSSCRFNQLKKEVERLHIDILSSIFCLYLILTKMLATQQIDQSLTQQGLSAPCDATHQNCREAGLIPLRLTSCSTLPSFPALDLAWQVYLPIYDSSLRLGHHFISLYISHCYVSWFRELFASSSSYPALYSATISPACGWSVLSRHRIQRERDGVGIASFGHFTKSSALHPVIVDWKGIQSLTPANRKYVWNKNKGPRILEVWCNMCIYITISYSKKN